MPNGDPGGDGGGGGGVGAALGADDLNEIAVEKVFLNEVRQRLVDNAQEVESVLPHFNEFIPKDLLNSIQR